MVSQEAARMGLLGNPLTDWPNDDLLVRESSRQRLRLTAPGLEAALHWPELLTIFCDHDMIANRARAANLRSGLAVVGISLSGLLIEALADLTLKSVQPVMHLIAAILMVAGFALGIWHLLDARRRNAWLFHRFWTERLRQFYFQFALFHVPLIARVVAGGEGLAELHAARARALDRLLQDHLADVPYQIERMLEDTAEQSVWIDPAWAEPSAISADDPAIRTTLVALARQRITVQLEYTRKKLKPGIHSPQTKARIIGSLSDLFTVVILLLTLTIAIVGYVAPEAVSDKQILLSVTAASAALIVGLRVIRDGCGFSVDTERYCWYLALTEAVDRRFGTATRVDEMVQALRDLEQASYQELRRFISTHRSARFVL